MSEYFISSVDKTISSDNNNETFVYIHDRFDVDFVVELDFKEVVSGKSINSFVNYMNYAFREKFYYLASEVFEGEQEGLFYCHLSCEDFECIVKSGDRDYLKRFIYDINNPPVISVDMIREEYDKLSVEIDVGYGKIRKLEKKRNDLLFKYLDRL
jgi:hypothetical protein